jgi:thiol-disulfide isomerase/thioredoxin
MPLFGVDWKGKKLPELGEHAKDAANWINAEPLTLASLRGRPVLVDFWEYSCINCLRTLPYLKSWYERYKPFGLEIIGIHVPEFEFGKDRANVEKAVKELGITWPVVLDNGYETWKRYQNSVWPREFLLDADGTVVHDQSGEGGYAEAEALIQQLIKRAKPDAKLPKLMPAVRDIDKPGAVCFRTSPELYMGFERGAVGNAEGLSPGQVTTYSDPGSELNPDVAYLSGKWESQREHLRSAGPASNEQFLTLKYHAAKVFCVARQEVAPGTVADAKVEPFRVVVEEDGSPLSKEAAGEDVEIENGQSYFKVDGDRLYKLVSNPEFGEHVLRLYPQSDRFGLYTFTFETACQT